MTNKYPHLQSPLYIKNICLSNRLIQLTNSSIYVCICDRILSHLSGQSFNSLSDKELQKIPDIYANAAAEALSQGYSIVSIDASRESIIYDSLSSELNKRIDLWGGNLDSRMLLLTKVIEQIQQATNNNVIIEICLNGADLKSYGYSITDGISIAKHLEGKADIIRVKTGIDSIDASFFNKNSHLNLLHASNLKFAKDIRHSVNTIIATECGLNDLALMDDIIASGIVDLIYCNCDI